MLPQVKAINPWQIFQLIRFGSLIGTNILFTKGLLQTSDIGTYESLLLIAAVSSSFWVSGIMQGLLGTFPRKEKTPALFNTFILLNGLSFVVAAILFVVQNNILIWFNISDTTLFVKLFIWYIAFNAFNNPTYLNEYFLMMTGRNKALLLYGMVVYFFQLAVLTLPLATGFSMILSIQLLACLGLLKWIVSWGIIYRHSIFSMDANFVRLLISKSVPLAAATLISGYAQYIDAWIVKHYSDEKTFAAFMYGAREFPLSLIMANALSETLANRIRLYGIQDSLSIIKSETKKLAKILFPLSCLLIVLSPIVFPLVFNQDFILSSSIFNIYLFLIIPRLLFPQSILIGTGNNRIIVWSASFELIINISSSLLLLHLIGIKGVAWGTVIAYMADKLFLWNYVCKKLRLHAQSITHFKIWFIGSIILIIFFIVFHQFFPT